MKIISIIMASLTALLLLSTLICGLWIKSNKITEISSINFHTNIGIAAVVCGIITIILLFVFAMKA